MFTAKTTITVEKDGCKATYESNKEQQGLDASICGGSVKVDKSGTPEAAIAAMSALALKLATQLEAVSAKLAAMQAGS